MNEVIKSILQHRTHRKYKKDVAIPEHEIQMILDAARQAPSWINGQHYSIIRITDPQLRQKIADHQPLNPQVGECSEFWVFIADARRCYLDSQAYHGSFAAVGTPDTLFTLSVDAALAAQNATVAAESLGYGTCDIGAMRMIAAELVDWLKLPKYTFPLFGLCIGVPATEAKIKPRLPQHSVVFNNQYGSDDQLAKDLADYEQTMLDFAEARETVPYRQKMAQYYSHSFAPQNNALLRKQGFLTHPDGLAEDQTD
ncbi:nitroreductase family protein [Neisseriaceae bacterium ESL0693]|nr:nitroreductase family protein [Neisseriaceae bacterium ESL0693]